MLKNSYYVNDQPNGNVYRGKLKDLYNNSKDNWYHQFGTMTFNLSHMNSILVASGGGLCLVGIVHRLLYTQTKVYAVGYSRDRGWRSDPCGHGIEGPVFPSSPMVLGAKFSGNFGAVGSGCWEYWGGLG